MKHLCTLFCLIVFTHLSQAQINSQSNEGWNYPEFPKNFVQKHNIRSIISHTQGAAYMRGGGSGWFTAGTLFEYDKEGRIVRKVEMENTDTLSVTEISYSKEDRKSWEYIDDRTWQKKYKIGYRFNKNGTCFQVKSYEIFDNQGLMLLDTRQFIHKENEVEVRFIERGETIGKEIIQYDNEKRIIAKYRYDRNGDQTNRSTYSYKYDDKYDRIVYEDASKTTQSYQYVYDEGGQLQEIVWAEDGTLRGKAHYSYDDSGKLKHIARKRFGQKAKAASEEKLQFNYEYF